MTPWRTALNSPGTNEAHRCALAGNGVARTYAGLVHALLRDAYQGNCACAVIISNDSDLLTPIRMAKEEWDAEKKEQVVKDELETVNQANALWARAKGDITEGFIPAPPRRPSFPSTIHLQDVLPQSAIIRMCVWFVQV